MPVTSNGSRVARDGYLTYCPILCSLFLLKQHDFAAFLLPRRLLLRIAARIHKGGLSRHARVVVGVGIRGKAIALECRRYRAAR